MTSLTRWGMRPALRFVRNPTSSAKKVIRVSTLRSMDDILSSSTKNVNNRVTRSPKVTSQPSPAGAGLDLRLRAMA